MAGTREGGRKAAEKNTKNNPNFYADIGKIGGMNGKTGGFASNKKGEDGLTGRQRARLVGKLGGQVSRRKKV